MKHLIFICGFIPLCLPGQKLPLQNTSDKTVICFTENKGQIGDQNFKQRQDVLFGGTTGFMVFHLGRNGISYQLASVDTWREAEFMPGEKMMLANKSTIYRIDLTWINSKPDAQIIKEAPLSGYCNYYSAVCPNGVRGVRSYGSLTYKNIYDGVDLKWYDKAGELKYDFICGPGVDYRKIQIQVEGAEEIQINSIGELEIKTPLGTIIEQAPVVKQGKKVLSAKWLLKANILSFEIDNVDRTLPFVIDPIIRSWGTYYGGSSADFGNRCERDKKGNILMVGFTTSTGSLLATVGSHQLNYGGGSADAFIAKFNSSGTRLWSTYYGGAGNDQGNCCYTDAANSIYMGGQTDSNVGTVIATLGSHQATNGGANDGFLVKFDSAGVRQWGTYYGGTGNNDRISACVADAAGNIYVTGGTDASSGTVIATPGSYQSVIAGGTDGFLAKFDGNGVRLWGTYYGGSGSDNGTYCVTDNSGNIYLTGTTTSTAGIATPGSHQTTFGGGLLNDAFLVKFNSSGQPQWATYYGGSQEDAIWSSALDLNGNIYVSGQTTSSGTAIATPGSHQPVYGGGMIRDGFLVKFNSNGVRQWGTFYGGASDDRSRICFTDSANNVYIAGYTDDPTGTAITTPNAYQISYGGGLYDAIMVKFNAAGVRQWGTYYGGGGDDRFLGGFSYGNDTIFVVGQSSTNTGTTIASPGCFQAVNGGSADGMLIKFVDCNAPAAPTDTTPAANLTVCASSSTTLYAIGNGTLNWFATPISTVVIGTGTAFVTQTLSPGTYTFFAESITCSPSLTRTAISVTVDICTGIIGLHYSHNEAFVFPNPTDGKLTVRVNSKDTKKLKIFDLMGKLLLENSFVANEYCCDLAQLQEGVYILRLESAEMSLTMKIVRQ